LKFKLKKSDHLSKFQLVSKIDKLRLTTHENRAINGDSLVFYCHEDKIFLHTSNGISCALIYLCEMSDEFIDFAIDSQLFTNAFANFPTDEVQFAFLQEENQLVFGNKKTRVALKISLATKINERIANEFYVDKELDFQELNTSDFLSAFKYTSFSCAPDIEEYPYTSIMFFIADNKFNTQSSDKHRISLYGSNYQGESSYLISKTQAELLVNFINKEDKYEYCIHKNKFIIRWGHNYFVTSLENNTYQSVFSAFMKFFDESKEITHFSIDKNEIVKSIKFISSISSSHTFNIKNSGSELIISSSSNDKGAVADKIALAEEIEPLDVSYLVNHFIKVLEIIQQDDITLGFSDYNGYTICVVQDKNFNHIMFPME